MIDLVKEIEPNDLDNELFNSFFNKVADRLYILKVSMDSGVDILDSRISELDLNLLKAIYKIYIEGSINGIVNDDIEVSKEELFDFYDRHVGIKHMCKNDKTSECY